MQNKKNMVAACLETIGIATEDSYYDENSECKCLTDIIIAKQHGWMV
ncbi:hypothetical protein [Butyrivibrio sp. AE3004]|nr:hypothetical protein [Butyrivibrio sp. AE3004]